MISKLIGNIVKDLLSHDYFIDYQFRKKDVCLVRKLDVGFEMIELQYWRGFDLKRDNVALTIKPLYLKRFDILHKWFEEFSFKSISDQRNNYSVGFDGSQLGKIIQFYFLLDEKYLENDLVDFRNSVVQNSKDVFQKFSSLTDVYTYLVQPIIEGKSKFPNAGADWIFEYLTVTKIVNIEKFGELKEMLIEHIKTMYINGEPNIIIYYPRLDEIINRLEGLALR